LPSEPGIQHLVDLDHELREQQRLPATVSSGGVLVQLVWNGGFTDSANATFKSLGEMHLVP
jgi:hypothetical protein